MEAKVTVKETNILLNQIREHQFISSSMKEVAASPKEIVLAGLCGCTILDVEAILLKMKVKFSDLSCSAKAELTIEHPKVFEKNHLVYSVKLENQEDKDKVLKAIRLSEEKYCGVSAMLRKTASIDWELVILE